MNIIAIIQARVGSTRLPNKVLLPFPKGSNKTVLDSVVGRVRQAKLVTDIVLTTPDYKLYQIAKEKGLAVLWYKGPRDVLSEYYLAARRFGADVIVRVTADCPLIDPQIIDELIDAHLDSRADYTYNRCDGDGGGDGLDVEVFNFTALEKAHKEATEPYDREHVTPYFRKGGFKVTRLAAPRFEGCSLNTWEDYELLSKLCEKEMMSGGTDGSTRSRNRGNMAGSQPGR